MRVERREPPRTFHVGAITVHHCADVELAPDEQITLVTGSGTEYDIVRKTWGYYATPSTNRRLAEHGLRAALSANADGRVALLLVERGHEDDFEAYLAEQQMRVIAWLDSDEAVSAAIDTLERP
jgi:hypothetical protein